MYEVFSVNCTNELIDGVLRERAIRANSGRSKEFVALINGEEAGFLSYEDWQDQLQGFIYEVFVLPEFRKQGIATLLIQHAEDHAIHLNCKSIRLKPRALGQEPDTSQLIMWYQSVGYFQSRDEPEVWEKFFAVA